MTWLETALIRGKSYPYEGYSEKLNQSRKYTRHSKLWPKIVQDLLLVVTQSSSTFLWSNSHRLDMIVPWLIQFFLIHATNTSTEYLQEPSSCHTAPCSSSEAARQSSWVPLGLLLGWPASNIVNITDAIPETAIQVLMTRQNTCMATSPQCCQHDKKIAWNPRFKSTFCDESQCTFAIKARYATSKRMFCQDESSHSAARLILLEKEKSIMSKHAFWQFPRSPCERPTARPDAQREQNFSFHERTSGERTVSNTSWPFARSPRPGAQKY